MNGQLYAGGGSRRSHALQEVRQVLPEPLGIDVAIGGEQRT